MEKTAMREVTSYGAYGHCRCSKCGAEVAVSHRYCNSCGARFVKTTYKKGEKR